MRIRKWVLAGVLMGAGLVAGCKSEVAGPDTGSGPVDSTKTYTYEADVRPIINGNCVSCHGNTSPSGGRSLTTYSQVSAASAKISDRINRNPGDGLLMPNGGPKLSATDLETFSKWVTQGKKEK